MTDNSDSSSIDVICWSKMKLKLISINFYSFLGNVFHFVKSTRGKKKSTRKYV